MKIAVPKKSNIHPAIKLPNYAFVAMLRRNLVRLGMAGGMMLSSACISGARSGDRNGPADPASPMMFDLPTQSLETALERYSIVSGWGRSSTRPAWRLDDGRPMCGEVYSGNCFAHVALGDGPYTAI